MIGIAEAVTPLLDKPLEGPVYLRSSSHKLPDVVAALNGQIDIDLDGRVDSSTAGGCAPPSKTVPDAPVTKFALDLAGGKQGPAGKQPSKTSAASPELAAVRMTGQNGAPKAGRVDRTALRP